MKTFGKSFVFFLILLFFPSCWTSAGEIYVWTDAKGVKRFSDHPPPKNVSDVQVIDSVPASDPPDTHQPIVREEYRRMMEAVNEENRQNELEKQQKAEELAAERRKKEEAAKQSRIDAERQRLQDQIDALTNRALSPGFTEGMRKNQINSIQRQMDQMEPPVNESSSN
jgi:hypothetical protein